MLGIEKADFECAEVNRQMALYPQVLRLEVVGIRWSKLEVLVVV